MKRRFTIAFKVNLIIVASLLIGIGTVIFYLSYSQYTSALRATDDALRQQSQILYYSIKNLMLPGEAPIARSFLEDMQKNAGLGYQIMLFRANGIEAFVDNDTIRKVNAINAERDAKLFLPRPEPMPAARTTDPGDQDFNRAAEMGEETISQVSAGGRVIRTLYTPLLNSPPCAECHGADHTVRGIIQIKTDLTEEIAEPRRSLALAGAFFLALVTLLALVLTQFMRASVIQPVKRIGEVCAQVTRGRFDEKVRLEKGDEIGDLGRTVNTMVDGLFERFELSKFVSSSTIQSIRDGAKGKRAGVTMLFSDVRGFTSYSEKQEPETIVASLNKLLTAQTEIIHANGGDVDKYVGDEIVAIFSGEGKEERACRSALQMMALTTRLPPVVPPVRCVPTCEHRPTRAIE